jgi:hypothetical protein
MSKEKVYFGETQCEAKYKSGASAGKRCRGKAYYSELHEEQTKGRQSQKYFCQKYFCQKYFCGSHSDKKKRQKLRKNPNAAKLRAQEYCRRERVVQAVASKNLENGFKGSVICSKMSMFKDAQHIEGFRKIYPNFKHQNRAGGFGCASLSPKSLGPINHKMPDVPIALNLENYHQGAKFFMHQVDRQSNDIDENVVIHFSECSKQRIFPNAHKHRNKFYEDPIPHRHKFPRAELKKILTVTGNINIPLFSMYFGKDGMEHRYSYLQCRYFYCHWYEKLAKETADFKKLKKWIEEGVNLQICGYDGYDVGEKSPWECYLDCTKPFGHELVLYTMLVEPNPKKYPWNVYYVKNKDIYEGVI